MYYIIGSKFKSLHHSKISCEVGISNYPVEIRLNKLGNYLIKGNSTNIPLSVLCYKC